MRIISQDGMADLPYERVGISINGTEIYANPIADSNPQDRYWGMAKYSTEARARKAIEMLRDAYCPKFEVKEPVPKEIPKTRSSEWIFTTTQPGVEVLENFYFQFPADDELAV